MGIWLVLGPVPWQSSSPASRHSLQNQGYDNQNYADDEQFHTTDIIIAIIIHTLSFIIWPEDAFEEYRQFLLRLRDLSKIVLRLEDTQGRITKYPEFESKMFGRPPYDHPLSAVAGVFGTP